MRYQQCCSFASGGARAVLAHWGRRHCPRNICFKAVDRTQPRKCMDWACSVGIRGISSSDLDGDTCQRTPGKVPPSVGNWYHAFQIGQSLSRKDSRPKLCWVTTKLLRCQMLLRGAWQRYSKTNFTFSRNMDRNWAFIPEVKSQYFIWKFTQFPLTALIYLSATWTSVYSALS